MLFSLLGHIHNMLVQTRKPGQVWNSLLLLFLLLVYSSQLHTFSALAFTGQIHFQAITTSRLPCEMRNKRHSDLREQVKELYSSIQGGNSEVESLSDQLVTKVTFFNSFVQKNFFLLGMVVAVFLAKASPSVSRTKP